MYKHQLQNPQLAYVVAAITGDGHLQIKEWRHLISFFSKEIEEIEAMKLRFAELFQLQGRIYIDNRKKHKTETKVYWLFFNSKPVALFLQEIGTPVGNKTNTPFSIPKWVLKGSSQIKGLYLQGLFDTEGTIFCRKTLNPRWQIGLKMAKNEQIIDSGIAYLNQIRQLLAEFQIQCSPVRRSFLNIRKDTSKSFELLFNIELNSFGNFYKYVGFGHLKKQEKLVSALATARVAKRLRQSPAEALALERTQARDDMK